MTEPKPPRPTLKLKGAKPAPKPKPRGQGPKIRPQAAQPESNSFDRPPPDARRAPGPAPTPARRPGPPPLARGPVIHTPRTDGLERLNKRLAALGHCSRREADEWIARGWVRVNGVVADMGHTVGENDDIQIQRQAHQAQAQRMTFLLHKPVGYVSGQPEDGHESAATLLSAASQWREDRSGQRFSSDHLWGLAPAGRLDIDSTGLLVLTQDGRVAKALIGEDSEVEKEYLVRVQWLGDGAPVVQNVQDHFPEAQLRRLRHGLSLDGKPLRVAGVTWQNPEQLRFVLKEGKKRQIRRMCEAVGLKVVGLKRVRIGQLRLGDLPVGQWRYLADHERF
jgi:23S rRNA pseudouridine2604 synthase